MAGQGADYPYDYIKGQGESPKEHLREMADSASKDTGERAQEMAGKVTEQAREYGEKAEEAARQVKPLVKKSLREQPLATLAGAAAIGFLLATSRCRPSKRSLEEVTDAADDIRTCARPA